MLGAGRFFVVGDGYSISRNEMRPPAVGMVRGVCFRTTNGRPYMVWSCSFIRIRGDGGLCSDAGCIVCFANSGAIPYGSKWSLDGSRRNSARYLFSGAHSDAPTKSD